MGLSKGLWITLVAGVVITLIPGHILCHASSISQTDIVTNPGAWMLMSVMSSGWLKAMTLPKSPPFFSSFCLKEFTALWCTGPGRHRWAPSVISVAYWEIWIGNISVVTAPNVRALVEPSLGRVFAGVHNV